MKPQGPRTPPGRPAAGEAEPVEGGGATACRLPCRHVLRGLIPSAIAGLLVFLSFPPADLWPLSYVALVPLLVSVCEARSWRSAAACGGSAALVAYLPAFAWLSSVTVGGWICLSLYVGAYLVGFAVLLWTFWRRYKGVWPVIAACAWVGLELVRAEFATGFPWLFYGHTQYRFIAMIQLAALTGAYGVSFLLVLLNATLAAAVLAIREGRGNRVRAFVPLAATLGLMSVCAVSGSAVAAGLPVREGPVVGVVQQNIPRFVSELVTPPDIARIYSLTEPEIRAMSAEEIQALNARLSAYLDKVFGRVKDEIDKAARLSRLLQGEGVELLVWPETTVAEPLNPESTPHLHPRAQAMQQHALETLNELGRSLNAYLCIGAPYLFVERMGDKPMGAYGPDAENNANSAFFIAPDGRLLARYDKMHLVPFGEYVPLRDWLPFLQALTPMTRQLTPGREPVIFSLPSKNETVRFGVVICYEDVVPSLVREFRRRGAQLIVNVTEEGWYHVPGELGQHVAMAAFRAVETRAAVVRAANTGISCFIDPKGRIYRTVTQEIGGRTRRCNVEGAVAAPVLLCDSVTVYVLLGDWFAVLCLLVAIVALVSGRLRGWLQRNAGRQEAG